MMTIRSTVREKSTVGKTCSKPMQNVFKTIEYKQKRDNDRRSTVAGIYKHGCVWEDGGGDRCVVCHYLTKFDPKKRAEKRAGAIS